MSLTDRRVDPNAALGKKHAHVAVITATSLTSAVVWSYTPGHAFQITKVRSFCRTKAGTVSFVVKVGGVAAVSSGTFTAATDVAQTLSTTLTALRGSSSEAITIELTTDGTGALTNGFVAIEYRAHPANGEAYQVS